MGLIRGNPAIVVARQSGRSFDCRARGRASRAPGFCHGLLSAIAIDVQFEDRCVVHEAIDGGEGHGLIGEDFPPIAEGLIGGDKKGSAFIASADQFEQHAGFGLILGYIGYIV